MISKQNRGNFVILIIAFICIILSFVFVFFRNMKFNSRERSIGLNEMNGNPDVFVSVFQRGGDNDVWEKALSEEAVQATGLWQMKGATYDAVVENRTPYEVTDWSLKLIVDDKCYLENAWCGKLGIYQTYGNTSLHQVIDLRNYKKNMLNISSIKDGESNYFPLKENDFFIYYPSKEEKEAPLMESVPDRPNSQAKFGFIVYTANSVYPLEFNHGVFYYRLNRRISKDPAFKVLVVISIIWFFSCLFLFLTEGRINEIEQLEERDKQAIQEVMETFSGFVDAKDPYTGCHSIRVAKYSKMIAKELGLDKRECQLVFYCGLLHDCGKIGIHDDILSKPEHLTEEEFRSIRKHTLQGFEILSSLTAIPEACIVARYHHERYDGMGYPDGLKGDEIPLYARIICLADSFDAMNSNRCYRKHMTPDLIINQIRDNAGMQFDPVVCQAMLRLLSSGEIEFAD